uniref:FYVE-type domain-containing protein n=1 Tax=Globisporangium ultimum (strain ATCC 200006 / CBS 805.95 / DAOM BR144) TaxID=431595 RepID=K3XAK9_GLOUD
MVDSHGATSTQRDSAETLSINTAFNSTVGIKGGAMSNPPTPLGPTPTATPTLMSARSVPAMSPLATGTPKTPGRGLRQKMIDELKNVRRKSPPPDKNTPSLTPMIPGASAGTMPPPLSLNVTMNDDYRSSQGEDGRASGSGAESPQIQGKTKGCAICERSFTVFRAKHTCKLCARRICDDCSKNRVKLNRRLERKKGSRLCDPCARKYVQGNVPMMSPDASPMLAPQSALQRRHSVPAQGFMRTPSGTLINTAATGNGKLATTSLSQSLSESSSANSSSGAVGKSASTTKKQFHDSHLRVRHWILLAAITTLVFLRILVGRVSAPALADGEGDRVNVSFLMSPRYFLARSLDSVLSIKILGCYILGLVVFDEIVRTKNKRTVKATRSVVPTRRKRTISALSEKSKAQLATTACPEQDDDEVLEVDTGDKVEETGFNLEKLIVSLEDAAVNQRSGANNDELKVSAFLSCCESICGFVLVFGRATSFAGSTVGAYITSIDGNLATWPAPTGNASLPWKDRSLRAVVEREVELKIASIGGKKKPSCSRCILRLLWFVEFVEACVKYTLIESTDENCSVGASKAYEETIGSRHPWIIRKGVNSALSSIPSRSAILADLNLSNCSPEDAAARLKVSQNYMKAIVAEIHNVLKHHELLDIK